VKRPGRSLPDTNAVVRYLVKDDLAFYHRAKEYFDRVKSGIEKAVILESVIAECIYVLTKIYKVPMDKAANSLIDILRYRGIANDDREELIDALTLAARSGIDIVDSILWAKAKSGRLRLFSFDEELNRLARRE
jgi:predicted nucleic acid-binding protein